MLTRMEFFGVSHKRNAGAPNRMLHLTAPVIFFSDFEAHSGGSRERIKYLDVGCGGSHVTLLMRA